MVMFTKSLQVTAYGRERKLIPVEQLLFVTLFAFLVNPQYKAVRFLQMGKLKFQVEPERKWLRGPKSSTGDLPSAASCFSRFMVPLDHPPSGCRKSTGYLS